MSGKEAHWALSRHEALESVTARLSLVWRCCDVMAPPAIITTIPRKAENHIVKVKMMHEHFVTVCKKSVPYMIRLIDLVI